MLNVWEELHKNAIRFHLLTILIQFFSSIEEIVNPSCSTFFLDQVKPAEMGK